MHKELFSVYEQLNVWKKHSFYRESFGTFSLLFVTYTALIDIGGDFIGLGLAFLNKTGPVVVVVYQIELFRWMRVNFKVSGNSEKTKWCKEKV